MSGQKRSLKQSLRDALQAFPLPHATHNPGEPEPKFARLSWMSGGVIDIPESASVHLNADSAVPSGRVPNVKDVTMKDLFGSDSEGEGEQGPVNSVR